MTDAQPNSMPPGPPPLPPMATPVSASGRGVSTRDPGSPIAAMVSWIVIALVVLFIAASVFLGSRPSEVMKPRELPKPAETSAAAAPATTPEAEDKGQAQPVKGMLSSLARLIFAYPKDQQIQALPQLAMFAKTDTDKLRAGLFQAGVGDRTGAAVALRKLIERAAPSSQTVSDAKLALSVAESEKKDPSWTPLTTEERDGLVARHGLFAQVLLLPDADPALVALRESGAQIVAMLVIGLFLAIGVAMVAFALFITAIVLLATGRIRGHCVRPLPGGSVYIETFALFLLGFIVLSLVSGLGLPDFVNATLRWSLLGIALWPMLRGVGFAQLRRDIGWTAGGSQATLAPVRWFKEMALGIAGYLALLPILGIGLACTMLAMFIINSFSSEPQSAAHPLGDELARAGFWGKFSLVILATVWAPVVEETFFRGALFRHLSGRMHFILAALLSGFIFAALHPQGLGGIPVLMAAGFNFAMLRQWRGGLIAPMTAHALNNGTITVVILLMTA